MLLLHKISLPASDASWSSTAFGMGAEGKYWKLHHQNMAVYTLLAYALCIAAETWPILSTVGPAVSCHFPCSVIGKRTCVMVAILHRGHRSVSVPCYQFLLQYSLLSYRLEKTY